MLTLPAFERCWPHGTLFRERPQKRCNVRIRKVVFIMLAWTGTVTFVQLAQAQIPARGPAPAPAPRTAAAPPTQISATLAQVMKGILYPASNVIFAAQDQNPADVPPAKDPSTATNPLASSYGKWEAIENAALALTESANLISIPGRKCSNGRDVPLKNADWPKLVQGLRDAGMVVYKAAQTKN